MIVLTINPTSDHSEIKRFQGNRVSIGSGSQCDLVLKDELEPEHLIIEKVGNRYLAINKANDPFVSLNKMPFGKKSLKSGDLIEIGATQIHFKSELELESIDEDPVRLEELIKQTEALPLPKETLFTEDRRLKEKPERKSLHKNLKEIESVREKIAEELNQSPKKPIYWRKRVWIASILFILIAILTTNFYFILTEKTDIQQIKAAQTMADAAMALMNAQLQHKKPANQNWSNPEFLRENLLSILSEGYEPILDIDAQGKFINYPYILRIYTSSDMSQFLIIAQPAPTLLQSLIPKTTLLVDSRDMTIRKTKDLRSLNRLLVNPNILDDSNSLEITNLIQKGLIIPLSTLAESHPEFAPPNELAFVRPEAENFIYNAPRYHKFNEGIIKKATHLSLNPNNTQSIAPLLQEIAILSKLHDMVLFAPKGLDEALTIQKGLMPFAPREGFLIGYLSVDPNTKQIVNSHLVLVANQFSKSLNETETHAQQSLPENPPPEDSTLVGVDIKHPLYIELSNLYKLRQQELCAHRDEIVGLINHHTEKGALNFTERLNPLLSQYQQKCHELQAHTEDTILDLYHDYVESGPKFPPPLFMAYVEAAGVENFLHDNIRIQAKLHLGNISSEELLEKLSKKIEEARDLVELDQTVEEASKFLTQAQFPEPQQLAFQQNKMRFAVIQKLENLLLFPKANTSKDIFHPKNRWVVLRILKNGRITDQDEREFYLNEFDNISMRTR